VNEILHGDCREVMRTLEAGSVNCCVTSPPYFGLRAYGTEPQVWGGSADCDHSWTSERYYREGGGCNSSAEAFSEPGEANARRLKEARWRESTTCVHCGAWRGELGLEPNPDMYVEHLVDVFREVRRVLRGDGTLWINLGDCYNAYNGNRGAQSQYAGKRHPYEPHFPSGYGLMVKSLKEKDLVGIPWRVAFALQSDGWWLRSDIIWEKSSSMPESVTDRPTRSHEYVFLLAKSSRYHYDQDAIREPQQHRTGKAATFKRANSKRGLVVVPGQVNGTHRPDREDTVPNPKGRNKRSVWTIPPSPSPEAHFAVMPEKLASLCILAGCPVGGTVLDPFAGSGTTGKAAQKLGRRAVLIDLNADYLEIAQRRNAQIGMLI
jgi:DNA modification methylase